MVFTPNAFITAILAVSTAAPILAAPLVPRIDSSLSSVNNRAQPPVTEPEAVPAPAPASAPEAAKTGTAQSGGLLYSPTAKGLLGRTALAAISSILRREPEFAGATTGGAAAASGAGFAGTNDLIQHFNRAGTPESSSSNDDWDDGATAVGSEPSIDENWDPLSEAWNAPEESTPPGPAHSTPSPANAADESTPLLPPSESTPSTPSTGIVSKLTSLVNTPAKAIGAGLTVGGLASAAAYGAAKVLGHRDLDADTLHLLGRDLDTDTLRLLLGRDLEDIFARSFGIDELD